jgi:HAE1 family hydrophobic/amphiphilic exporter-1
MILASQFKSFLQPLALMTSLPLTLIGVVLALLMFGSALSMFSIIGVVMLMGLVTKNAILLVDFAIRAREDSVDAQGQTVPGLPRRGPAAGGARAAAPDPDDHAGHDLRHGAAGLCAHRRLEQRAPMGQAVIGGVITSSLLTLVVVPVVYCYLDDLAAWLRRRAGRGGRTPASPPRIDGLSS